MIHIYQNVGWAQNSGRDRSSRAEAIQLFAIMASPQMPAVIARSRTIKEMIQHLQQQKTSYHHPRERFHTKKGEQMLQLICTNVSLGRY